MSLLVLKNVVVAAEPNEPGSAALTGAVALANAAGASLHVVSVVASDATDEAKEQIRQNLRRAVPLQRNSEIHVVTGDAVRNIGSFADRVRADVIVLGRHREGRSSSVGIGGTALAVVTNASCPCLVIARRFRVPLEHVLVPVDSSETARGALMVGLSWASALRPPKGTGGDADATLTALHVQAPIKLGNALAAPELLKREVALVREAAGSWADVSVREETTASADAARGIAEYVTTHTPDFVVMGTRGLGLDAVGRLGSVAAAVARLIEAPLLLVPPALWGRV